MNHSAVSASRCDACHNGSYTSQGTKGALGTASYAGHVATNGQDCVTCHATRGLELHQLVGGDLHSSTKRHQLLQLPQRHDGDRQYDAAAHSGHRRPVQQLPHQYRDELCHLHDEPLGGERQPLRSCHNGSYTSQGTKGAQGTASYPGHVATAGRDCVTCHAAAATTFTSWAGGTYAHQPSDTNCSTCHNGTTAWA